MSMLLTLGLVSLASAGEHELAADWGGVGANDPGWDTFSERDRLSTWGVRGGYGLSDNLTVLVGYQRRSRGMDHRFGYEDELVGVPGGDEGYVSAFYANTWTAGVKLVARPSHYAHPYVTAQASLTQGRVRLDDDPEVDDNLNQLSVAGLAPGAVAAAGLEVLLGPPEWPVWPALHAEAGYGWSAPMALDELGDLQFKGFVVRSGLGLRF